MENKGPEEENVHLRAKNEELMMRIVLKNTAMEIDEATIDRLKERIDSLEKQNEIQQQIIDDLNPEPIRAVYEIYRHYYEAYGKSASRTIREQRFWQAIKRFMEGNG